MTNYFKTGGRFKASTKHVYIAVPTYGPLCVGFVNSLLGATHHLAANNVNFDVAIFHGNCHVDDSRNDACRMFLESEATHLMFIDADVHFSNKAILSLLSYDEHVIGGVYPKKDAVEKFPVVYPDPSNISVDERGLVRVKALPGGFLMLSREVVQKLYDTNKSKGMWVHTNAYGSLPMVEIFHRTVEEGRSRRSGDYEACFKIGELGYELWCLPNLNLPHEGSKVWTGTLQNHIFRRAGIYEEKCKEIFNYIANGGAYSEESLDLISKAFDNEPFSISIKALQAMIKMIREFKKPKMFETGTGLTTAVASSLGCYVTSLESSALWGSKTVNLINLASPSIPPDIIYAPIKKNANGSKWYDESLLPRDNDYDIVVIDGPKREQLGMRKAINYYMPWVFGGAKYVLIDDAQDRESIELMQTLNEQYKFEFVMYNEPTKSFAVGEKK